MMEINGIDTEQLVKGEVLGIKNATETEFGIFEMTIVVDAPMSLFIEKRYSSRSKRREEIRREIKALQAKLEALQ